MQKIKNNLNKLGFTLIEIILVIGIIAILATVVIVAINPFRQFAQARNSQRSGDVETILNEIYQYAANNIGALPATITTGSCSTPSNEICKTGGTCTGLTDLSVLTLNETYMVSMPFDPTTATTNGTGYYAFKSANGRVTVCAPGAELSATISVTK